jgi:two-component system nitrate/nitrite response regulator NarL
MSLSAGPLRLAIVDDHPTLLMGLAALLGSNSRYVIAGTGEQAADALVLAAAETLDVLLVDLSMPGDVFAVMRALSARYPTLRLLVFTAYADVGLAISFVLKGSPVSELHDAIAAVAGGQEYVSPGFAERLHAALRERGSAPRLSLRERQLVDCLLAGMSNREIAGSLALTEKTIKHYMTNVMNKLNAKSRLEVALAARRLGLDSRSIEEEPLLVVKAE